jgi:hypothetical protein
VIAVKEFFNDWKNVLRLNPDLSLLHTIDFDKMISNWMPKAKDDRMARKKQLKC